MATAPSRTVSSTLRQVGARIRMARTRNGLTLAEVGEATGLTPSMLSMVERGVATPSIGALVAISDALKIPMASVFGPTLAGGPRGSPVVQRQEQPVMNTGPGVQRRLIVRDTPHDIEIAENTYLPGAASADRPIHHLGREFGVVLSGRMQIEVDGRTHVLQRGDAISFDSSMPHRFANIGKEVARTIWVNVHSSRSSRR